MKHFLLIAGLMAFLNFEMEAQRPLIDQPIYTYAFTLDTLTNTETVNFELPSKVEGLYDISYVIVDTEISGTATNTMQLQQTVCATCSDAWVNVGSGNAVTATGNSVMSAVGATNSWGYRYRLQAVNSGTGVHSVKIYAIARKRV